MSLGGNAYPPAFKLGELYIFLFPRSPDENECIHLIKFSRSKIDRGIKGNVSRLALPQKRQFERKREEEGKKRGRNRDESLLKELIARTYEIRE